MADDQLTNETADQAAPQQMPEDGLEGAEPLEGSAGVLAGRPEDEVPEAPEAPVSPEAPEAQAANPEAQAVLETAAIAGDTVPAMESPQVADPFEPTTPPIADTTPHGFDAMASQAPVAPADASPVNPYSQPVQPTAPMNPAPQLGYVPQGTSPMPNPIPGPQATAPFAAPQQGPASVPPVVPPAPQAVPGMHQGAPAYGQQQATAPYAPAGPVTQLSGGLKFGWLCIGLVMGVMGMLMAWLVCFDKHPQVKKDAIVWSVIGFAIHFVFGVIAAVAFTGMMAALATAGGYYGGGYYF